jgi:hypothetical protein
VVRRRSAILIKGWIPEPCFREFVEALVHLIGNHRSNPDGIRLAGSISLDASGRLDQFYWQRLRTMVALSQRFITDTWVGFSWRGECEARCELQLDDGYAGVCVRVEVPDEWASRVEAVIEEVTAIRKPAPVAVLPVARTADSPPAPVPVPEPRSPVPRPPGPGLELRPELVALLRQMYSYMVKSREELS